MPSISSTVSRPIPASRCDCLKAALAGGARWIVLCDTNGGTLPHEIERIVGEVAKTVPRDRLGIHCHNDTGQRGRQLAGGGARRRAADPGHAQRPGRALRQRQSRLADPEPDPEARLPRPASTRPGCKRLTHVSRLLDERLNRAPNRHAPYVGESAFAHKGGLHVSAVEKDPRSYEHVDPATVGNHRHIVVSDQAGRANLLARLREIGIDVEPEHPKLGTLLDEVKEREFAGYAYDGAEASFELLARRTLGSVPEYFRLQSFRVLDERRWNAKGELVTLSEATIKVDGRRRAGDGGRRGQRAGQRARRGAAQGADRDLPRARRHPPHRLQGAHPDAAGRHRRGDAGDDRDLRATAARPGRPWAFPPTSSTPPTTRSTTASPTSSSAPAGARSRMFVSAPIERALMALSARSGEREGTRRGSDGEGEVCLQCQIALAAGTHLTRSLRSRPLPRKRAGRAVFGASDGRHRPPPRQTVAEGRRSSWSSRSSARISAPRRAPCSIAA